MVHLKVYNFWLQGIVHQILMNSQKRLLQAFAIEFVTFAVDFVLLAVEFVGFAVEFVTLARTRYCSLLNRIVYDGRAFEMGRRLQLAKTGQVHIEKIIQTYYHLQHSTVLLSSLINALIICNLLYLTQLHAFNVILG